jgi:hypothetical protein
MNPLYRTGSLVDRSAQHFVPFWIPLFMNMTKRPVPCGRVIYATMPRWTKFEESNNATTIRPHVLFLTPLDVTWGALSTKIPNCTSDYGPDLDDWKWISDTVVLVLGYSTTWNKTLPEQVSPFHFKTSGSITEKSIHFLWGYMMHLMFEIYSPTNGSHAATIIIIIISEPQEIRSLHGPLSKPRSSMRRSLLETVWCRIFTDRAFK